MYRTGHYGISLLVYAPVWTALLLFHRHDFAIAGLVVVLALAHLPDYDRSIPFVRHRGPTHTLAFAWLVGVGLALAGGAIAVGTASDRLLASGFGLGLGVLAVTAHLVADVLTPAGVELLWPFSRRRYSLHISPADDEIVNYSLLAVGLVVIAVPVLAI